MRKISTWYKCFMLQGLKSPIVRYRCMALSPLHNITFVFHTKRCSLTCQFTHILGTNSLQHSNPFSVICWLFQGKKPKFMFSTCLFIWTWPRDFRFQKRFSIFIHSTCTRSKIVFSVIKLCNIPLGNSETCPRLRKLFLHQIHDVPSPRGAGVHAICGKVQAGSWIARQTERCLQRLHNLVPGQWKRFEWKWLHIDFSISLISHDEISLKVR